MPNTFCINDLITACVLVRAKPEATEKELVAVGRIVIAVMAVLQRQRLDDHVLNDLAASQNDSNSALFPL